MRFSNDEAHIKRVRWGLNNMGKARIGMLSHFDDDFTHDLTLKEHIQ